MLQQEPIIPTVQRPTQVSEALSALCAANMNYDVIALLSGNHQPENR
jgi:hypothetical protein